MAQTQDVIRASVESPRCKAFPARALNEDGDPIVFYRGAIVCKRIDSELVEIPDPNNPRTDLIPLGIAKYQLDMTGKSDAECSVVVEPGNKRDFKTGTGDNEITVDHVGQTWYMFDDETAYLTDDGGTLSPGGTIVFVDEDEYDLATNVTLHFDYENMQVLSDVAAAGAANLAVLASDASGEGASLVAIEDAGGYTTETNVEGALQEIYPLVLAGMTASKKTLTANATTITAAASSEALNIGTSLPANSRIVGVDIHTLTVFSGGSVADFTVDIGTAGDVDALIDGADLFAAAVDGGPATIPQGIRPNKFFAAGGQLIATFRCASDDVGDATAGAVTIDVIYVVLA